MMRTSNVQRRTPNIECSLTARLIRRWTFDVGRSTFLGALIFLWLVPLSPAAAQTSQPPALDPLLRLMMTQPSIEVATNVQAISNFDPPIVAPGETSTWRVTFNALDESIRWPENVSTPPQLELQFSARGEMLIPTANEL